MRVSDLCLESADRLPSSPAGWRLGYSRVLDNSLEAITGVLRPVSHMLSNLLIPVTEYPRLLAGEMEGKDRPLRWLDLLSQSSERICRLNQGLVRLCHGHEGTYISIRISELVDEVWSDLSNERPDHSCRWQIIDHYSRGLLKGPYNALYHVIHDLATNALQAVAHADQPLVVVEIDRLHLDTTPGGLVSGGLRAGDYLTLRFKDNGAGIPPDYQQSLFDPFVSAWSDGQGDGLGLSCAYRVMRHLKGCILYRPDFGHGGDFMLCFPV